MIRAAFVVLVFLLAAGCGQKGPLIAPEPEPVEQAPAEEGDDTDDDAEAKRRRGS